MWALNLKHGKKYSEMIVHTKKPSFHHELTKIIFRNQWINIENFVHIVYNESKGVLHVMAQVSFQHSFYKGNQIGILYVISILTTKITFRDKDINDNYL